MTEVTYLPGAGPAPAGADLPELDVLARQAVEAGWRVGKRRPNYLLLARHDAETGTTEQVSVTRIGETLHASRVTVAPPGAAAQFVHDWLGGAR